MLADAARLADEAQGLKAAGNYAMASDKLIDAINALFKIPDPRVRVARELPKLTHMPETDFPDYHMSDALRQHGSICD